jgi:hypothetical protein
VQSPVFVPVEKEKPPSPFTLPEPDANACEVERYPAGRGISRDLITYCLGLHTLYRTRNNGYANAVFVGCDTDKIPRYATVCGMHGNFKGDVSESDKRYSFALTSGSGGLGGHGFFIYAYFRLRPTRIERPQIGGLLDFVVLVQTLAYSVNLGEILVHIKPVCRARADFTVGA